MANPESPALVDPYVFLLGRPPIGELLGFIRNMARDGADADQAALAAEWRLANDRVAALERDEAGIADHPPIRPLPPAMEPVARTVREDPMYRRAYGLVPTEIGLVELDRLVVFQKFINLGFVEEMRRTVPGAPDEKAVARLALGIDRKAPDVRTAQHGSSVYSFLSPSNDIRFLESTTVPPDRISGLTSTGRPVSFIILGIGFGSNYLNALHVEDRLVLNNGSHRAYLLRQLGVTHAPCVIQHVSRREELDLVGSGDFKHNPDRYLKAARPPLLGDYFDDRLRKVFPVPRKNRLVRVQITVEQSDVPA